tara:strand:+ start:107 stop:8230 length:8124 start_codon:yes stop_codon:yes gene_type:complete
MSCRYITNEGGNIVAAQTSNGKVSQLFKSLKAATENITMAQTAYNLMRSEEFFKLYGKNFEEDASLRGKGLKTTDENGEPILLRGAGSYYVMSPKGRIEIPGLSIPLAKRVSNLPYEKEKELLETLVMFVNDFKKVNPKFNATTYFGTPEGITVPTEYEAAPDLTAEEVVYTAQVVNNVPNLKKMFPPVHPNEHYHHSTNQFKPESLEGFELGKGEDLKIVGRLTTDKVDTLIVDNKKSNNKHPHITLSTAENVKPFASNKEIAENLDKIVWFDAKVPVTQGYFNGTSTITSQESRDRRHSEKKYDTVQERLFAFLERYGFEINDANGLLIDLGNKKIDLDSSDVRHVAKALAAPLAVMLSYTDYYNAIYTEIKDTDRFKNRLEAMIKVKSAGTKIGTLKRRATIEIFQDLLESGFSERLAKEMNVSKTLLQQLMDFVREVMDSLKGADFNKIKPKIDEIIDRTFEGDDFIRTTKKEGYVEVEFQEAFNENDIAREIMTLIGTHKDIALTGSIAYAPQGTTYRKIETVVHDLDFMNFGLSREEVGELLLKHYPDSKLVYSFTDRTDVDTFLVPPKGLKLANIDRIQHDNGREGKVLGFELVDAKGEVKGTYKLEYKIDVKGKYTFGNEIKDGAEAMFVDFFSNGPKDLKRLKQEFIGSDGNLYDVDIMYYKHPIDAKLEMSRFKDVWDYNRFIPYGQVTRKQKRERSEKAQEVEFKGILAETIATQAFEGLERDPKTRAHTRSARTLAAKLAKIGYTEGPQAMIKALPKGVTLSKNPGPFLTVYRDWLDVKDTTGGEKATGNLYKKGWRSALADLLEEQGLKLKDSTIEEEDPEEDYVKIHSISRLQEDPKDKLSSTVKSFLLDIRSSKENSLGYKTAIPLDEIYSEISEATVDKKNFDQMFASIKDMVRYKPELTPVLDTLSTLTERQKAAFFSNFKNSYKKFLQFKTSTREILDPNSGDVIDTVSDVMMFRSDQSSIATMSLRKWREQSAAKEGHERSLYIKTDEGTLKMDPFKRETILKAWEKLNPKNSPLAKRREDSPLESEEVELLHTILWNMSMQFGMNEVESLKNLTRYFELGPKGGDTVGFELFQKSIFDGKSKLQRLITAVSQERNIYGSETLDIIKKWSTITPYFIKNPAQSFLGGANKIFYPINTPTSLDETVLVIQDHKQFKELYDDLIKSQLFSPGDNIDHDSILLYELANSPKAREMFTSEVIDSYKGPDNSGVGEGYTEQNSRISLLNRLNGYANNGDKGFFKLMLSIQADRSRADMITIPRLSEYSMFSGKDPKTRLNSYIKGIIMQDIHTMVEARKEILEATDPETGIVNKKMLWQDYHYKAGTDPAQFTGNVFKMSQIGFLAETYSDQLSDNKSSVAKIINSSSLLELLSRPETGAVQQQIELIVDELVEQVQEKLDEYTEELEKSMLDFKIDSMELHESIRGKKNLAREFIENDFIGRIETNKLLRGGMAFTKDAAAYFKRMGLINTPGNKLHIRETPNGYGMMETYNAMTFKEMGFEDQFTADQTANTLRDNIERSGTSTPEDAVRISDHYRDVVGTDAQAAISIEMHRGLMMGQGEWDMALDEEAYLNEQGLGKPEYTGLYVDNNGNPRPLYPSKPFHEELTVKNNLPALFMDKNSYFVVTRELAKDYPILERLRTLMEKKNIHVANEENATKGARRDVRNLQEDIALEDVRPVVMQSSKLRIPQTIPRTKKDKITFSRQIRKNIIANWRLNNLEDVEFQNLLAENIDEDKKELEKELGITALKNAGPKGTIKYRDAKLAHLKKLRAALQNLISDKGLPDSYLGALNIVPNTFYDYEFAIPMAFPNYQAKYEQMFLSLFNKKVFTQKQKGKELVQIAELGGHKEDGELQMYDGTHYGEARMRASDLGFSEEELEGKTIDDFAGDPRLVVIGYRIPNQGKNSMIPLAIKSFLPETHLKGIIVPKGITKQMGSDFDVDKLIIIQREQTKFDKDGEQVPRNARNQRIFDIMENALTSIEHLAEVTDPLDGTRLSNNVKRILEVTGKEATAGVDYNNPLAQIDMEMRNKAGVRLRGSWANQLAGHNVAQAKLERGTEAETTSLSIKARHGITINGKTFTELGKVYEYDFETGEDSVRYNSVVISEYLSAAVDAAHDPIQIDINDNEYTVPITGMMLSMGIPIETILNFLTQPAIIKAVEHAKLNGYHSGELWRSIKEVKKEYKKFKKPTKKSKYGFIKDTVSPMTTEQLQNRDPGDQIALLDNFKTIHKLGRQVSQAFKVITPDNLSNVNEISSVRSWLENEEDFIYGQSKMVIGIEAFLRSQEGTGTSIAPLQFAYRNILDTMMEAVDSAGFINNSIAFESFKTVYKSLTHQDVLSGEVHKFIDRALFLKIMAKEESPFAELMSKKTFERLYTSPNSSITNTFEVIKTLSNDIDSKGSQKSVLSGNTFFENLQVASAQNSKGIPIDIIELNTTFNAGPHEKNAMTEGFRKMLNIKDTGVGSEQQQEVERRNNVIIRRFAKDLISNQLMTKGFHPGKGTYIDLIPPEVFTSNMGLSSTTTESPVAYFNRVKEAMTDDKFFKGFVHSFIRNFGTANPGGNRLVPKVNPGQLIPRIDPKTKKPDGSVHLMEEAASVFRTDRGWASYFIVYNKGLAPKLYVKIGEGVYKELEQFGSRGALNEVGNATHESAITELKSVNAPTSTGELRRRGPKLTNEEISAIAEKIEKICRLT